jgi:hypothetical protein
VGIVFRSPKLSAPKNEPTGIQRTSDKKFVPFSGKGYTLRGPNTI